MKLRPKSKASLGLVAMTLLVLMLLANSRVYTPTQHSREAVLKADLRTIRDAIDNYTLRAIPVDPITSQRDWLLDFERPIFADPVLSPDLKAEGLVDVHSNSNQIAQHGSRYKSW